METYAFIVGSSPELALEELLTILKPMGCIVEVSKRFLIFQGHIDTKKLLSTLGGTVKIGKVGYTTDEWHSFTIDTWLQLIRHELTQEHHRFNFGASVYSSDRELRRSINVIGLELKKHIRKLPLVSRFVFNTEGLLSSVMVQKNKLLHRELLVIEGKKYYFAITQDVQDFEAYGKRDYGRPERNAVRGMLPPKVAQMMLNLCEVRSEDILLDPFCGGGTVLQEALLMGVKSVWGSDNDPSALAEAEANLTWLSDMYDIPKPHLQLADIFHLDKVYAPQSFDRIVTEPYMGPARLLKKSRLTRDEFLTIQMSVEKLLVHLFEELAMLVKPGGRAAVIVPLFNVFGSQSSFDLASRIGRYGWVRCVPEVPKHLASCSLSPRGNLVYSREDQIVAREITLWERKK